LRDALQRFLLDLSATFPPLELGEIRRKPQNAKKNPKIHRKPEFNAEIQRNTAEIRRKITPQQGGFPPTRQTLLIPLQQLICSLFPERIRKLGSSTLRQVKYA